jgi:hypothetical protein
MSLRKTLKNSLSPLERRSILLTLSTVLTAFALIAPAQAAGPSCAQVHVKSTSSSLPSSSILKLLGIFPFDSIEASYDRTKLLIIGNKSRDMGNLFNERKVSSQTQIDWPLNTMKSNSIDNILVHGLIDHLPQKEALAILTDMFRSLREGGQIRISFCCIDASSLIPALKESSGHAISIGFKSHEKSILLSQEELAARTSLLVLNKVRAPTLKDLLHKDLPDLKSAKERKPDDLLEIGESFSVLSDQATVVDYLGAGGNGAVYLVRLASAGDKLFAAKIFFSNSLFNQHLQLHSSDHLALPDGKLPAVVLADASINALVLEYYQGFTVREIVERGEERGFTAEQQQEIQRRFQNLRYSDSGELNVVYSLEQDRFYLIDPF